MEESAGLKSKELYPGIFSRHAAAYQRRLDDVMSRGEARGRERVLDFIGVKPGLRVLDLACGPGTLTARLAALVGPTGEAVGVDLAPGMIELARGAHIAHARFEVMDIENLAFDAGSFDAAACGHGLQFVPSLARALAEIHRVVKAGARFAASVPVGGVADSVWAALEPAIARHLPPAPEASDDQNTRAAVGDVARLRAAALQAGFESAEVEAVDERATWDSPDHFVASCTGWWSCAVRLERASAEQRQAFLDEALAIIREQHAGGFETAGRSHVLFAIA